MRATFAFKSVDLPDDVLFWFKCPSRKLLESFENEWKHVTELRSQGNPLPLIAFFISEETESLLDVGSGYGNTLRGLRVDNITCVDIFQEALQTLPDNYEKIHADARTLKDLLSGRKFDMVTAYDFIEHLPKEDSQQLLSDLEQFARKGLLFFVPLETDDLLSAPEYHDFHERVFSSVSADYAPYQAHLSRWTAKDLLARGYDILEVSNFHCPGYNVFFAFKIFDPQQRERIRSSLQQAFGYNLVQCKKTDHEGAPQCHILGSQESHATIGLPFDQYHRYKIIQEAIDLLRDGEAPLTVLDVSGLPDTLRRFLPGDRVIVADLQNSEGVSVCANGCRLPFLNHSFDVVVSSDTLEHIPPNLRPQFLGELVRVTRGPLLLDAPFDDPQVVQVEEILQQLSLARYGERHYFSEEHRQHGLPNLTETLSLLHEAGFDTVALPNGYLYRWIVGISLGFLLQSRFDDLELSARVNAFYNRSFYRQDNREPSYRKLIVAARGREATLSRLADVLLAPATHDPAVDLMVVQTLNLLVQMAGERWSERALQAEAEVARLTQEHQVEMARLTEQLNTIYTSKTWRIASKGLRVYQLAEASGRRLVGALGSTGLFPVLKKVQHEIPSLLPHFRSLRTRDLSDLLGPPPTTYDVIYLASIDWDFRYQRPQQVASQLARHGHRVFYVSPARFLPSSAKGRFELRQVKENVFEILLPIPSPWNVYGEALSHEHVEYMLASLKRLCQEYQIASAVTFVLMASWGPLAFAAKEAWGWKTVYDCMDEWDNFPLIQQPVLKCEKRLVEEGDLTVVTGQVLYDKWSPGSQHCVLARNGVDFDFFAANCRPNDLLKDVKRPIIGYYGAIADWLDTELIEYIASRRPEWSFVLLGGVFDVDVSGLEALPNVHLLGNQPYEHMPLYLYHFDACIIPFKVNPVTHAVDPVKFYEFMSAGKAVVAVKLAELLPYKDYLHLAEDEEDFFQKLEMALAENDLELAQRRIELASQNTWDDRYQRIDQGIKEVHPKASIIIVTYNNADLTRLCVESIYRNTTYPNYEIIIVDNCSEDSTRTYLHYLARAHNNVKVILNANNAGFARANNQGIQAAEGDYIVLLNNDTVVTRGWLTTLIGYLADPRVGLVGPVTNLADNEAKINVTYKNQGEMEIFARKYVQQHAGQYFDIRVLAMYCLAMRRDLVDDVGLLGEGFTAGMFEDDYANRVREKEYRVICAKDVFIHHFGQSAFKKLLERGGVSEGLGCQ